MFYVYRFLDKDENIIYVGKSKQDLEQRFKCHTHLPTKCYDLVYKIEFIECPTESDMSIKEIYYINKYSGSHIFFNVTDTTELPTSVQFNDEWKIYQGSLGSHFHHSINYIQGYTKEKEIRYNKDGSIDRRKSNSKSESTYVEGFTREEVDLLIEHFISEINTAETDTNEQIRFRNLLMFVLAVNLPIKPNIFLQLKYKDLFDENDCPKPYEMELGSFKQNETIHIPLKDVAKKVLCAYVKYCGFSYANNANDSLFQSRKNQIVSPTSWGRILKVASATVGIDKKIGAESARKAYGLNIFHGSSDKLNALLFLGEIWGHAREAQVIKYLNLTDNVVNFEYYLGNTFSIGNVDLLKIECLQQQKPFAHPDKRVITSPKHTLPEKTFIAQPKKEVTTNRLWPKEKKLEIILKHLELHIPQKDLAEEYGVDKANISRWVNDYKNLGATVFEDKRFKHK